MIDLTKLTMQGALEIQASEASGPAVDESGAVRADAMTILEALAYQAKLAGAAAAKRLLPSGWSYPTNAPAVRDGSER